jgi:hypothetical protein
MLQFCNVKNQGSGIAAAQREETGAKGVSTPSSQRSSAAASFAGGQRLHQSFQPAGHIPASTTSAR